MSKSTKTPKSSSNSEAIPYEVAMEKLGAIVEELETEELSLEKLLARYQEGNEMVSVCQKKLSEAGLKIQQLEKKPSGEFDLKDITIGDSNE